MIEVKGVSKSFYVRDSIFKPFTPARKVTALQNIDLIIEPDTITALIGPNGAGKTTLLKIVCGLVLPDKGKVDVTGSIGYLSSEYDGFYQQLTARQNIDFFGTLYNITKKELQKRLSEYLQIFHIDDLDKQFGTPPL